MNTAMNLIWGCLLILLTVGCGAEEKDYIDRMRQEHADDKPVQNEAADLEQASSATGQEVVYATVNGQDITGYLSKPDNGSGSSPGIIVIHEWWGLNDNIRMMADRLAGEGYTALAVDLYNGNVAESPDSAGIYARSVKEEEALDNLTQAYQYLTGEQNAGRVGTIGWCFGGGWSLQTALALPDKIDATVIYYGRLVTDAGKLKKLGMPVIGFFGAEDNGIPPETVHEFESALNEAGVKNSIHIYEGAGHAFANPSGTRYVKEAAENAWQKTVAFLAENLKQ